MNGSARVAADGVFLFMILFAAELSYRHYVLLREQRDLVDRTDQVTRP